MEKDDRVVDGEDMAVKAEFVRLEEVVGQAVEECIAEYQEEDLVGLRASVSGGKARVAFERRTRSASRSF
jgi:hypothetical protein